MSTLPLGRLPIILPRWERMMPVKPWMVRMRHSRTLRTALMAVSGGRSILESCIRLILWSFIIDGVRTARRRVRVSVDCPRRSSPSATKLARPLPLVPLETLVAKPRWWWRTSRNVQILLLHQPGYLRFHPLCRGGGTPIRLPKYMIAFLVMTIPCG